ncbi:hypothetical protein ACF0H5_017414 [Mactra antiquata]
MMSGDEDGMVIDLDKSEAYYLRLYLLLTKHGKGILKSFFDVKVPDFRRALQANKPYLNKLKLNRNLPNRYYDILYPTSGNCPNPDDFDITLLVALLRHISGLKRKSRWWDETDNTLIPNNVTDDEADIVRIRNIRNSLSHVKNPELELADFQAKWDEAEEVMLRLATKCNINDFKASIDDVKTKKLDLIPEALRSLRENTCYFLREHSCDDTYVETDVFKEAQQLLKEHNIVLLSGHRGEGKTSMAAKLALSVSGEKRCLLLQEPSDWYLVDLSLKLIQTIIIDNLYGQVFLDPQSVASWAKVLNNIVRVTKTKEINAIITSVSYVLKQSDEEIGDSCINNDDNYVCQLTSSKLSRTEKIKFLNAHARKWSRKMTRSDVVKCVEASSGVGEGFNCGFPLIVSEFCKRDELYKLQAQYFKTPSTVFIKFLNDMYLPGGHQAINDKFWALLLVWSKADKILNRTELEVGTVSEHVKGVLKSLGRSSEDFRLLERMLMSLESHVGGYLKYNNRSGDFEFTHSTICDRVGLAFGKKRQDITLEICPRDFFMQYVVISSPKEILNEFSIVIEEFRFLSLAIKCCKLLLNPAKVTEEDMHDDFDELQNYGKRGNKLYVHNLIDFEIIKHCAFNSTAFVYKFIEYVKSADIVDQVFGQTILSMSGRFLQYGISMEQLDMRLLDYALFRGLDEFTVGVLSSGIVDPQKIDLKMSLLLAIHSKRIRLVNRILDLGARVTGDAIHIAVCRSMDVLESLLKRPNTNVNVFDNSVNGNYPLIIAASKGNYDAVKRLLEYGADPSVCNTRKSTALHKAILYPNQKSIKRWKIISILIGYGAPLDIKGGIRKRTPLHLAVDLGDTDLVSILIRHGASLYVPDKQGYYPIHTAVRNGNIKVVKQLFGADRSQEKLRMTLSKNTFQYEFVKPTKGMSIFHLATMIYKMTDKLIYMNIDPNIKDYFGRTPLIYALDTNRFREAFRLMQYCRVDKSLADKRGRTPLHVAIYYYDSQEEDLTKIVDDLIPYSNVNAKNKDGETPLHIACDRLNVRAIDRLLRNKADYRMITSKGDSVFHCLNRNTHPIANVIIEFILQLDPNIDIFLSQLDLDLSRIQHATSRKTGKRIETLIEFLLDSGRL